MMRWLDDRYF